MTIATEQQIPEIDSIIAALDLRINKKQLTIEYLEGEQNKLSAKIARHKADLHALGRERAEKSTFTLI